MSETPGLGGLGNWDWLGALLAAQRQAPLRGEGQGEGVAGLPAELGLRAMGAIVRASGGQRGVSMVKEGGQRFVQELVSDATVGRFDKGIRGRLSGCDVVPIDHTAPTKLNNPVFRGRHHRELGCKEAMTGTCSSSDNLKWTAVVRITEPWQMMSREST